MRQAVTKSEKMVRCYIRKGHCSRAMSSMRWGFEGTSPWLPNRRAESSVRVSRLRMGLRRVSIFRKHRVHSTCKLV
jgi:hypothetical protein